MELFNLSKNFLEKIPDSIGLLKKLQILKVDQNKLLELSSKINGCEELTELVLTENLLSQIPDELTELKNLTNLAVDRNRLSELPESIGLCTKLRMLHLRENNLTLLPESLANCTSLTVLDVAENNLLFLPARMQELQLKAIWLSENQNQPLVKFHEETISFQGEERDVLLCYMLPQKKKTQEVILRRSIIESDDGTFAAGVLRRTETRASVTFDTEPPKVRIIGVWTEFQLVELIGYFLLYFRMTRKMRVNSRCIVTKLHILPRYVSWMKRPNELLITWQTLRRKSRKHWHL